MATVNKLRKMLHRKSWEMCVPAIVNTAAGAFSAGDKNGLMPANDCHFFVQGASAIYNYNADEDAWLMLPSSGIAGAFAAGACGEFRALGMLGGAAINTATAGGTTTLTTNRTLTRDIRGSLIRVVGGTGVGYEGTVAGNTVGANSVMTVSPASGVAFDATTQFQVWSGSLWFFNAGTSAVGFSVYDRATNSWTAKSVTNLPTSWGTTGQLVATDSVAGAFETGTTTSATATTLTKSTAAWPTNAWANAQVRIAGGTGAGQVRTVASNTGTTLTVSSAWTVTPDATSTYSIEGNDDLMYLLGNNAVTLYRYALAGNSWSTLTPGTARAGSMGAGGTADWISGVTDADWAGAQGKQGVSATFPKQNGRYIYSFRGGASSALDVYDLAGNAWAAVSYGQQSETFTTGSCAVEADGYIYLTKEATGRIYRFAVATNALEPYTNNVYPQSTAVEGDRLFIAKYRDGATVIPYLYVMGHSRNELLRTLMIGA